MSAAAAKLSVKAHFYSVTFVISIPMEEENHICDANATAVLVNVAFCIPHTRLIRVGSFVDSNLALCDPQIGGGEEEVCALECVCLDGPSKIYIFLFGETTAGCDSQNVITGAGGAAFKWKAIFSAERCFFFFLYAFVSQTRFPEFRSSGVNLRPRPG